MATTRTKATTFAELQRAMQLSKTAKQGVKYTFRNAEEIYTKFKELGSDWTVIVTDQIIELAGRFFIQSTATCKKGDEVYFANGYAELDSVPVFKTGVQQMQVPQWTGAVSSYARKYALQALFAIGEKDVDDFPVEENQAIVSNKAVEAKIQSIADLSNQEVSKIQAFVLKQLKLEQISDISKAHLPRVEKLLDMLEKNAKQKQGENNEPK
jgi:phosphopantetheine adenylyltransferase